VKLLAQPPKESDGSIDVDPIFARALSLRKVRRVLKPEGDMRGTQFAELSIFVAVAEQASFTRAAKRLGRSTATLSQTVRALEERLGVRLLNRTTRSVSLTDAGERLMKQLQPLFEAFDEAVESVNAFRDKPAGHLRLLAPPLAAKCVLAPLLTDFLFEYPEISVEVSIDMAVTEVVASHFDAGFRQGDRVAREMSAVRISDDLNFVAVASPEYLALRGKPMVPSDLHAHNCIRLRLPGGEFLSWAFHVGEKTVEFEVEGSVIVSDPELALSAALEGLGINYTLDVHAAPMIADGRLVRVLEESGPSPTEGFFLFYPNRAKNPATLQALIDFLRASIGTHKGHA
jgi:DNA-binding transcriptional LysR family regulator